MLRSSNVNHNQSEIILLRQALFLPRPRCKIAEQRIREAVRRKVAVGPDICLELFLSEKVSRRVCSLDDSVGLHEDPVAGSEPNRDLCVFLIRAEAQRQAVFLEFENRPLFTSP